MHEILRRIWGGATALMSRSRRAAWVDLVVLAAIAGLFYGVLSLGREWTGDLRPAATIETSPRAVPIYAFYSLCRGLIAYSFSLAFTLVYGYWAARDRAAERVLLPLLDILQSIPVLGFMPGLVLALVAIFPRSNVGVELAAVLMIFTGQVWNMTFSFYSSLKNVPTDLGEVARAYNFNWWQRLRWLELPSTTIGLVWNSMMSMAGGWFFLMISEAFVLGDKDYRLPGLGSYMSAALTRGDSTAMLWAILAMAVVILALDQFLWRPLVVWAQKFRIEEGSAEFEMSSWFLDWLRRSRLYAWTSELLERRPRLPRPRGAGERESATPAAAALWRRLPSLLMLVALVAALGLGGFKLADLLRRVSVANWGAAAGGAAITLTRVLAATTLGTLWAVPAGIAIGLDTRLARYFQPVVQFFASFPAPMLFPAAVAILHAAHVSLNFGSIFLMLLGTQWYILFNVIAGAQAIPADLREAARSYRFGRLRRFFSLELPAVFPYLVTGWVTAAGGAWNASIVAEYVTFRGDVLTARGVGAMISVAAEKADFPLLAASVTVMSAMVVLFNRLVWHRCYDLAATRFAMGR